MADSDGVPPERVTAVVDELRGRGLVADGDGTPGLTAMGEAFADFMALNYSPVLAGVVVVALFVLAMALQLRAKRYNAWIYWFAVA